MRLRHKDYAAHKHLSYNTGVSHDTHCFSSIVQTKDEDKELIFLEQVFVEAVEEGKHDSQTEKLTLPGVCLREK